MIVVQIKDNEPLDKALKRFKKKFEKTGVLKQIRSRTYFEKPSERRRQADALKSFKQDLYAKEHYN